MWDKRWKPIWLYNFVERHLRAPFFVSSMAGRSIGCSRRDFQQGPVTRKLCAKFFFRRNQPLVFAGRKLGVIGQQRMPGHSGIALRTQNQAQRRVVALLEAFKVSTLAIRHTSALAIGPSRSTQSLTSVQTAGRSSFNRFSDNLFTATAVFAGTAADTTPVFWTARAR